MWRDRAACASNGRDLSRFFDAVEDPDTGKRRVDEAALAQCRAACMRCPVRLDCYAEEMATEGGAPAHMRFGVRAGTTPEQRDSLYRRFAVACPDCGETYDPLGAIDGLLVCACGDQRMWSVDDRGDQWLDRHSALAMRVRAWLARESGPGARVPSPTSLARDLRARRDDVIRVYRALVRDGRLIEGEGRGVFYNSEQ